MSEINSAMVTSTSDDLQLLLAAAEEAEARYDPETAVAHFTAALALPDLTWQEEYEMKKTWSSTLPIRA